MKFKLLLSLVTSESMRAELARPDDDDDKFITPLFACSFVMSYKVLPVLFFIVIIRSDLPLASWLNNNNYCPL